MTDESWFRGLWYAAIVLSSVSFVSVLIPILRSRLRGRFFCFIPLIGFVFGWSHVGSLDVRRRMIAWTVAVVPLFALIPFYWFEIEAVGGIG